MSGPIFFALGYEGGRAAAAAGQRDKQSKRAKPSAVPHSSRLGDLDKLLSLCAMFPIFMTGIKSSPPHPVLALGRIKWVDIYLECDK